MRKILLLALAFPLCIGSALAQRLEFEGASGEAILVNVEANSGLDGIYVLQNTDGVEARLPEANAKWYKFGSYGAAYAEEAGEGTSLKLTNEDCGLVVEAVSRRYCFWIVNYANHRLDLHSLSFSQEQECDRARLELEGDASAIHYYTINGQRRELSRELTLSYANLEYDAEMEAYAQKEQTTVFSSIEGAFGLEAPLCDTYFTLMGDRFLREWGKEQEIESGFYHTIAVDAHTSAAQEQSIVDNQQNAGIDGLGGSAPCAISFRAAVTDAAVFTEWQISRDPEFEAIDDRYRQLDFDYTFHDNGTAYVRFVCDNDQGTCEYVGETYEVFIGESALLCPNAFSPGASEGVNDEWKVSYKSIVKYECHIFNRWGTRLFSSTDPAAGWDGKHKGKLVPSGAYYYVIKAVGSDGKKYDLAGDINILRSKASDSPSASDTPAQ